MLSAVLPVVALKHKLNLKAVAGSGRRLFFLCSLFGLLGIGASAFAQTGNRSSATAYLYGDQVAQLDEVIEAYERIAEAGGWEEVTPDDGLVPGGRSPAVRELRQRLRASADFTASMGADPFLFNRDLLDALRRFQLRHGLQPSGVLDRQTIYALNQPVERKLAMLRDARERWANVEPYTGNAEVWVNLPEARVAALENNSLVINMRAIVGQRSRQTPELTSTIRRVVVNPPWTVPRSIATKDLLPKQQADGTYLTRNNIRVYYARDRNGAEIPLSQIDWSALDSNNFPYQLKQDPGPSNSLGRLKFDFANDYDVFLHDTPGQSLLGLSYRSLSSGCVRLSKPEPLAAWLLDNAGTAQLADALGDTSYQTRSLKTAKAATIKMVYLVAWISKDDGTVQFRSDIYNKVNVPEATSEKQP